MSGLTNFELMWEKNEDTRVLLGWGPERIMLSFRGTASWTNACMDAQMWLTCECGHTLRLHATAGTLYPAECGCRMICSPVASLSGTLAVLGANSLLSHLHQRKYQRAPFEKMMHERTHLGIPQQMHPTDVAVAMQRIRQCEAAAIPSSARGLRCTGASYAGAVALCLCVLEELPLLLSHQTCFKHSLGRCRSRGQMDLTSHVHFTAGWRADWTSGC